MAIADTANETQTRRSWLGFISNVIGVSLAVAFVVGTTMLGIFALHSRAENTATTKANPPITVTTTEIKWADHYDVERNFVGRLEPTRQTSVAFERGGLVMRISADEGDKVRKGSVLIQCI